jgi:hypothetical protein
VIPDGEITLFLLFAKLIPPVFLRLSIIRRLHQYLQEYLENISYQNTIIRDTVKTGKCKTKSHETVPLILMEGKALT